MADKPHPEYEKFLWDRFNKVQEKLGTGTIKTEKQLQKYVFSVCGFPSAIDAFAFITNYASYSWSSIVSVELLHELSGDLEAFIKQTVNIMLALDVMLNVKSNSDGYRYLIKGGQTATVTLKPNTTPVRFTECWKSEAAKYQDHRVLETVTVDDGEMTIYQLPDDFQWVYIMNHIDASLVWIGKPVEN